MRPSIEKLFHLKRLLSSFEVIACACLFSNRSLQVRNFAILSRLPLLRIERHHLHLSALRAKHHDVSIEEPTRDGMCRPSRDEEGRQVGIDSQRHHTAIRAEAPIRAIAVQRTDEDFLHVLDSFVKSVNEETISLNTLLLELIALFPKSSSLSENKTFLRKWFEDGNYKSSTFAIRIVNLLV